MPSIMACAIESSSCSSVLPPKCSRASLKSVSLLSSMVSPSLACCCQALQEG